MSDDPILIRDLRDVCRAWFWLVFVPLAVLVLVGRCESATRADTLANICAECRKECK